MLNVAQLTKVPDNRIGSAELTVPAKTSGPPPHWHEMHDETFLITKGMIRFHVPNPDKPGEDLKTIDAYEGDYVTVPTHSPHTFSNPSDGDSKFFNTFTPAYYINYFKLLGSICEEGKPLPAEANMAAMALYATIPVHRK